MTDEAKLITVDILQEVVAKDFQCPKGEVQIIDFNCSQGSNKGENFTCILVSVQVSANVSGKHHDALQYMAKCIPSNEYRANFLESCGGFDRECLVYGKILPILEDLRKSNGLDPITFPKCFYASSEKKIIVMENLRVKDYVMVNFKDITIDHFKTILREIGRYHASTYHLLETYTTSKFIEDFPSLSYSGWVNEYQGGEAGKEMEMMMNSTVQTYIQLIKEAGSEEEVARLLPKLVKFEENRRDLVFEAFEPTQKFNVLIHNDLWTNNMLFKTPKNICFVDLQFVKRCPPTIDLAYLFGSSSTTKFREKHFDELMKLYHESLTDELKLLGYSPDIYTFDDLMKDFDKSFVFGMIAGLFHSQIKIVPMDGTNGIDFDDMQSEKASEDMMEKLSRAFLDRAKAMPDFLENIMGLLTEAEKRNVLG